MDLSTKLYSFLNWKRSSKPFWRSNVIKMMEKVLRGKKKKASDEVTQQTSLFWSSQNGFKQDKKAQNTEEDNVKTWGRRESERKRERQSTRKSQRKQSERLVGDWPPPKETHISQCFVKKSRFNPGTCRAKRPVRLLPWETNPMEIKS